MKKLLFPSLCSSMLFLGACSTIRTSKYAKYNEFTYTKEQPRFNFKNDTLDIEGSWNWASNSRAIPKLSFIPKIPRRILRPIAKEHGSVLFATWFPLRKKYSVEGHVPVTQKDVGFTDKNNNPFYIMVLINERSFNGDTIKYKSRGRNNDYQFELYSSKPQLTKDNYWIMEVIATNKKQYYDFVCIVKPYGSTPEIRDGQARMFLEDIKIRFLTRE